MKIRLFTSWYDEKSSVRREELTECLNRNFECDAISEVALLVENTEPPPVRHPKLRIRLIQHRPQYQDFIAWSNALVTDAFDITVICNSDIYFESSLTILGQVLSRNQCAALSRWDRLENGQLQLFDRSDSQDSWIFKGATNGNLVADYPVGVPRCDNRFLWELRKSGYEVINPAFSIRSIHLHHGQRPEYPTEISGLHVPPPYAYQYPHNLFALREFRRLRRQHPDIPLYWRMDHRKLKRIASPRNVLRHLRSRWLGR